MMQATEGRVARGWESKAIESQQDEAERRGQDGGPREPSATDARRTLELARAQVVLRRDAAKNDAQRAAAAGALDAIDAQLAEIGRAGE